MEFFGILADGCGNERPDLFYRTDGGRRCGNGNRWGSLWGIISEWQRSLDGIFLMTVIFGNVGGRDRFPLYLYSRNRRIWACIGAENFGEQSMEFEGREEFSHLLGIGIHAFELQADGNIIDERGAEYEAEPRPCLGRPTNRPTEPLRKSLFQIAEYAGRTLPMCGKIANV